MFGKRELKRLRVKNCDREWSLVVWTRDKASAEQWIVQKWCNGKPN